MDEGGMDGMRLRLVLMSVLVPVLVIAAAIVGGRWAGGAVAADTRSATTSALDSLPADTQVAGVTDWSRIRQAARRGLGIDGVRSGGPDRRRRTARSVDPFGARPVHRGAARRLRLVARRPRLGGLRSGQGRRRHGRPARRVGVARVRTLAPGQARLRARWPDMDDRPGQQRCQSGACGDPGLDRRAARPAPHRRGGPPGVRVDGPGDDRPGRALAVERTQRR